MFKESAKKTLTASFQGTLQGIDAETLIKHLGAPKYDDAELGIDSQDNATSMQWVFEDDAANVITLYDWRGTAAFNRKKPVTWSIGAANQAAAVKFRNWLSAKIYPPARLDSLPGVELYDKLPPGF